MSLAYLPWGIIIGLIMAAPIGPVNIICIRRDLTKGPMNGFVVGLGAAIADGLFGAIAAFGLAGLTGFIEQYNNVIEVVGAIVLLAIAAKLWFSHPHANDVEDTYKDRLKAASGTFLLTLTNPLTVLGFVATFVGLGLGEMGNNLMNATLISLGILMGSCLWWAIVSFGSVKLARGISDKGLEKVNHISAIIILMFGLFALIKNMIN